MRRGRMSRGIVLDQLLSGTYLSSSEKSVDFSLRTSMIELTLYFLSFLLGLTGGVTLAEIRRGLMG